MDMMQKIILFASRFKGGRNKSEPETVPVEVNPQGALKVEIVNSNALESVTAGAGLANSGTAANPIIDVNVDNSTLEINADIVRVRDLGITAATLAADSVTTAKILDLNVTAAKLAADAVETAKIKDLNVTAAKLAADSVTTAKILDANVTTAKLADLAVTTAKIEVNERWLHNFLINDFRIAQRQAPATPTAVANQGFGADRWKCFRSTTLEYRRYERGDAGSDFTSTQCHAYGRYSKPSTAEKFQVCQIIEAKDTSRMRGQACTFRVKLRADAGGSARKLRIGLIEWTGTADTLTAAMISSYNGASSDPTLAASYARVASADASVTTVFQEFTVTGTPSSTCNNLIVAIWTDDTYTTGQYIEVAEPVLALGSLPRIWVPGLIQQELALCQRYCLVLGTQNTVERIGVAHNYSTTQGFCLVNLPVDMRIVPAISVSDHTKLGAISSAGSVIALSASSFTINSVGSSTRQVNANYTVAAGLAAGNGTNVCKNSDTTIPVIFDSEL